MRAMDCHRARQHFSEHLDGRLAGEVREGLTAHLLACRSCSGAWRRYRRVFGLVGMLREDPGAIPFRRPPEPPGAAGPGRPRRLVPRRVAAAAAVLLVLGASNVLMFLLGHGDLGADAQDDVPAPAAGAPVPRAEPARLQKEWLRDHMDASYLTVCQASLMPEEEQEARDAAAVVRAKLDLLQPPEALSATLLRQALGDRAQAARSYLRSWERFTGRCRASLAAEGPPAESLRGLASGREARNLLQAMARLWPVVAREASGEAWRREQARLQRLAVGTAGQARDFLVAEKDFLTGDYPEAQEAFRTFQDRHPRSRLRVLGGFMEAESWCRMRRFEKARQVARSLEGLLRSSRVHLRLFQPFSPLDLHEMAGPVGVRSRGSLMMVVLDPRQPGLLRLVVPRPGPGGEAGMPSRMRASPVETPEPPEKPRRGKL